jgi:transcriptional regulator with XRE-family HTH domain
VQPPLARVLADLGDRLAELRGERGWTQQVAAERLAWGVRDYRAVELGTRNLTIETVVTISRVFNVSLADLFGRPASRAARGPGRPRIERAAAEATRASPRRRAPKSEDG